MTHFTQGGLLSKVQQMSIIGLEEEARIVSKWISLETTDD